MACILKGFSSVFLGFAVLSLLSPLFLYWLIYGNYERYVWIINGPAPFNQFGSGPFQLWMGAGFIFMGAVFLLLAITFAVWAKKIQSE
ncbi:hypothetical protein B0X71_08355 [Planococcus lenghuensis]|uniref:Uncharacterized protein n=1 Tax=Planococcus lenghuensis TaxID=2213202 RepID=A0A1Q2KY06_9BACL|nr:hypothetical protein B0X71_08355 [Planococcus lenghuensis]